MIAESTLMENEPASKDPSANKVEEYKPTDEQRKTLKMVNKLFDRAKQARSKYDEKWLDYYKMYRGSQWPIERPSYRHSEVINLIWKTIQSQVPILTDRMPKAEYLPQEPTDLELATILNDCADHDWRVNNWIKVLVEIFYDGGIIGNGFGHCGYDPEANYGMGQITFESPDVFYVFPGPGAKDVNVKCRDFHVVEIMDLDEVKRKYPTNGKFVKADVDSQESEKGNYGKVKLPVLSGPDYYLDGNAKKPSSVQKAMVICSYVYDDEFEEERVSKTDEQGKTDTKFIQKKKYPNGRKIVWVSDVLLTDGANPFEDGKIPYQKYDNYPLPHEFWSEGDVVNLQGPQKIFNKLLSFALDVLTLMGNPIWLIDSNTKIDVDNLFNRPGEVIVKAPGTNAVRQEGVQLQPYVLQLMSTIGDYVKDISGDTDVSNGVRPEGANSGYMVAQLMEASKTRLRQKSRNMDAMLQDFGQQYKNRVFQFYTTPRVVRLTNNDDSVKYFKFHIEHSEVENEKGEKTPQKVAKITHYNKDQTGNMVASEEKRLIINGDFDVKVSTGSLLPFSRVENEQKLLQYYDRGIIDAEEVLKRSDYPNYEAVLQRVMANQAKMAAARPTQ